MSSVYSNYVKRMRMCANENCKGCTYQYEGLTNTEECKEDLLHDAAEQLEDADKCNARLVKKCKEMEKRIAELEAQLPKEGEWIEDYSTYCGADRANYKCSLCGKIGGTWRRGLKQDELPPFCGSCGARMKTVTDCHTLVEGEHDGET